MTDAERRAAHQALAMQQRVKERRGYCARKYRALFGDRFPLS
jgi:hypothetical protein